MDLNWLVPITGLLTALGGGIAWWFNRSDKRRDKAEMNAIELLKQSLDDAQKREAALVAENEKLEKYGSRIKSAAGKWREQLISNGITPIPADWPGRDHE